MDLVPYYNRDGVTLYNCRHDQLVRYLLEKHGEECADAIITDSPYGRTNLAWDRWPDGWPMLVRPVLKRTGSMWAWGTAAMWWERADEFKPGWRFAEDTIWEKHNGSGFARDRFRRVHEQPYHFYRTDSKWTEVYKVVPVTHDAKKRTIRRQKKTPHTGEHGPSSYSTEEGGPRLMRSVIYARSCHGHAKNEAQKPPEVIIPQVENASAPGDLVLDFFVGAGTTALVCLQMGRRFIGCEVRESQCRVAVEELEKMYPRGRLVVPATPEPSAKQHSQRQLPLLAGVR